MSDPDNSHDPYWLYQYKLHSRPAWMEPGEEYPTSPNVYRNRGGLYQHLLEVEGEGDHATGIPTGKGGVTKHIYNRMKDKIMRGVLPEWTQESTPEDRDFRTAGMLYLDEIYNEYRNPKSRFYLEGFSELPQIGKDLALSAGYSMGTDFHRGAPRFQKAIKEGDIMGAAKQLLDTANSGGRSLLGLAKRRAVEFNRVADVLDFPFIEKVRQDKRGNISYFSKNEDDAWDEVFSYRARRHPKSQPGSLIMDYEVGDFIRVEDRLSGGGLVRAPDGRRFF